MNKDTATALNGVTAEAGSPVLTLFRRSTSRLVFDDELDISASAVAQLAADLGSALVGRGLRRGERVGLWMGNGLAYLQSFLACAHTGLVAVSVNTRYSVDEVATLLGRTGVRAVITDQDWQPSDPSITLIRSADLEELAVPVGTPTEEVNPKAGAEASRLGAGVRKPGEGRGSDRCVVFTTSGTTSRPKLVVHDQASIAIHATEVAVGSGFGPTDTALVTMPLCGTFGLTSLLTVVAAHCEKVLVPSRFEATESGRLIAEHQVTLVNGSDDMFHRLLGTDSDLSSVRLGGYARFNTSLDGIVERADERGMTLTGLYGMSEVQALFTIRDASADAATRSLAGGTLTSERAHARVIDGELQLRGPSMFGGYLAEGGEHIDRALTASAMDEGWFKTGDSAEQPRGSDGRDFTFVSRMGEVLRIGGFLVAPAEIEQVIMRFGGDAGVIEGAQVVAVDRPTGARPVAFVVLSSDANKEGIVVEEVAVMEHCGQELARFKIPIRVVTLSEFPMVDGPNGLKVRRNELRSMAEHLLDEELTG